MELTTRAILLSAVASIALALGATHQSVKQAPPRVSAAAASPTAASTATVSSTAAPTLTSMTTVSATPAVPASTPTVALPVASAEPIITKATISSRVVEDSNRNGVSDAGDVLTSAAPMVLVPWSDPSKEITLITAKDGAFSFTDLPSDSYTIRIAWPTGFVGNVTADDLPNILRVAFRVTSDGKIDVPSPFPDTWPGIPLEKFDPVHDRTILGALPDTILVNYLDPRLSAILPGTGETGPVYVGAVDVAKALRGGPGAVSLPPTGSPAVGAGAGSRWTWLAAAAIVLSFIAAAGVRLRRD